MENPQSQYPILNAVMSQLVAERDNAAMQVDIILNRNNSNMNIVQDAVGIFKKLSELESTIELVERVILDNQKDSGAKILEKINSIVNKKQSKK